MKINFTELTVKIIQKSESVHKNVLASAIVTFKGPEGEYFSISSFTVWKSKDYDGYNVTVPQSKSRFKYCLIENSLWKKIKQEILQEYEKFIPIVEESNPF